VDASYVEHCKNVLRTNGYVVIPKERRVILTANYVIPDYAYRNAVAPERLEDAAQTANLHRITNDIVQHGLFVQTKREWDDEVTGHEGVVQTAIAVIKPKP
jgi:hypothetical protein